MMFLKFHYRLGYESLCCEVSDSITWRRFCRIPIDGKVPHPATLMKLTTRCGTAAVEGCNQALLAKAAEAKLLRTARLRADTTVVAADVAYPTDSGLLARAVRRIAVTGRSGGRGESHPPAPTDPGVTVSRHRALVILVTKLAVPKKPISSARTCEGIGQRCPASTRWLSSRPAAACTSCGSSAPGRR